MKMHSYWVSHANMMLLANCSTEGCPTTPGRDKSAPTQHGIASLASPEEFASGIF
jgi:hypothetical protein